MQKSPFKFLDSYSREDRDLFFGRDKEIEELHSRVFESRILIVYGISGTGKSSLINCGLANKFNDSDWLPIAVRRGININQSLQNALSESAVTETLQEKTEIRAGKKFDIIKVIRSIYLDHFKPVYLIFDQFEEVFIFGTREEKDELTENIRRVIESDLQCRFIFSIREEYLAALTEFEKIIPSFLSNRIRIEKMTRHNAIQVIEGPCRVSDISIEQGFSEALLEKLSPGSSDVELTYLQVFLDRIMRLAAGYSTPSAMSQEGQENPSVNAFSVSLLSQVGNVSDLLGRFLEEQISRLEDPDLGLVILKSFVSVKGTKHQITEEEVIEYSKTLGKSIDVDALRSLIQRFITLRILRDKDQDGRYELRHDSLATKIYEKITLVEKELLEIRQFIENAFMNFEKRQLYLTSEDLNYIAPYEDKLFLNERVLNFISHSKKEIHRTRRRRQNVFFTFALIIISVLFFFTVWALRERGNALRQKQYADVQKNAAVRAKEMADSARLSAMNSRNLAMEKEAQAVHAQQQSEQARKEALAEREYALVQKNRAEKLSVTANEQAKIANDEKIKAEQERTKAIAAEANANRLTFVSTAQNLALTSSNFKRTSPRNMAKQALLAYEFNRDNGGEVNDPVIWEALNNAWSTLDSSRHSMFTGSPNEVRSLAVLKGELCTADLDGQIRSWNSEGNNKLTGNLYSGSPLSFIRFSPDGQKILSQYDNTDLLLWETKTIDTEKPVRYKLQGHSGLIATTAFSTDGKLMATSGSDSLIIVWKLDQSVAKAYTLKSSAQVIAIVFCGNDSIITALESGNIVLWNISGNEKTELYKNPGDLPLSLAWNDKKRVLFAGCTKGSLLWMNIDKYKSEIPDLVYDNNAGIDQIKFNQDFTFLAISGWDKTLKVLDCTDKNNLSTVSVVIQLNSLGSRIRSMIFTPEGRIIAGLSDNSIRLWETSAEALSNKLKNLGINSTVQGITKDDWYKKRPGDTDRPEAGKTELK
jgi:WD40 repeat protein